MREAVRSTEFTSPPRKAPTVMLDERFWPVVRTFWRMKRGLPTFVSFNVTNRCSECCPMCSVWRTPAKELGVAEMEPILRDLHEFGLTVLEVSGGEPFVRDDIFEVFSLLERIGFLYTVTTNATVLPEELPARLHGLRRMLQLAVSLDSLDRDTYSRLRGRDILPTVLRNIETLAAADLPAKLKINVAVSRLNYGEVPLLLDYARRLGCHLSVFPVTCGEGFAHRHTDPLLQANDKERSEMSALFRELARLRQKGEPLWEFSGFYEQAADFMLGAQLPSCDAGRLYLDIRADGTLAPCLDQPIFADLCRERVRDVWPRLAQQEARIRECACMTPCCYTCTYNISLTARHLPEFILESALMLARSRRRQKRSVGAPSTTGDRTS